MAPSSQTLEHHQNQVRFSLAATPLPLNFFSTSSLNSRLNFLLVSIGNRPFHLTPQQSVFETDSSPEFKY
jgi:hypothetical protein